MACEAEQAALNQAVSDLTSAVLAAENSAIVIDQLNLQLQQAIAVGMQNVEAVAAAQNLVSIRQQQLVNCQAGGTNPPAPMMAEKSRIKDHCLQDCLDLLVPMRAEIAGYFTKFLKSFRF